MEKHILSKTTYIKGEQCLKQLYLTKNQPKLRDRIPAERLAIFNRGTNVGIYAQELFPGGIDAGPKHYTQYKKAIQDTAELIKNGQKVIYEAAFQAHKTLILLDILVKDGDAWDAYEVKSSRKLSETYYKDAALQYHVLTESGINIRSFSLIHINENYIREGEIDIHKLFTITDVTAEVQKRSQQVALKIDEELTCIEKDDAPNIAIGPHCFAPYDCDFIGHCWKSVKKPSIFDIPSLKQNEQFSIFEKYKILEESLDSDLLNDINRMQITAQLSKKPFIDTKAVQTFIPKFEEAYILKVLHFAPALPLYDNTKPYETLCFGFALQKINANGSKGEVIRYMSMGKENPADEVSNKLQEMLTEDIPVFIFSNTSIKLKDIETTDLSALLKNGSFYRPKITKDYTSKSLAKAMGIQTPYQAIEMDIVAAHFYEDILRGHKNARDRFMKIRDYFDRELRIISNFLLVIKQ